MTENKRFTVYDDGFSKHIIDNSLTEDKHEGNIYDIYEMCNKLNELNDENTELKNENEQLKSFKEQQIEEYTKLKKVCTECKKENEQLKEIITGQRDTIKRDNEWENKAIEEIKQLKQQITHLTIYKNLFREFQKQLDGVKKKSDLDHKDFEDLIELTKGHVFDDEHGWIWLPVNDYKKGDVE